MNSRKMEEIVASSFHTIMANDTVCSVDDSPTVFNCSALIGLFLAICLQISVLTSKGTSVLFALTCTTIALLLSPFVIFGSLLFFLIRETVDFSMRHHSGYLGLMTGSDAFWAWDCQTARSVINVLAFVDFGRFPSGSNEPLLITRDVIERRVMKSDLFKFHCKKGVSSLGYYFWEQADINVTDHVKWWNHETSTKEKIEHALSEIANEPIFDDRLWEVRVGKETLRDKYPVVFRIHHSVGDGHALVKLFTDKMSDKTPNVKRKIIFQRKPSKLEKLVTGEYNRHFIHAVTRTVNKLLTYLYTIVICLSQFTWADDVNSLHGPRLSGQKVVKWAKGDLNKLRMARRYLKCRFTDVILMAVSDSMKNLFDCRSENVENLTMVLTARLSAAEVDLTNSFTVAMMKLPVSSSGGGKFGQILEANERIRSLPDFQVNYWLLRVACTLLPMQILGKVLESTQCTLVLSNVPGPTDSRLLNGNRVDELMFWLPNRDTTGVGISIFSYDGQITFGLSADRALINDAEGQQIVDGITESIDRIYRQVVTTGRL